MRKAYLVAYQPETYVEDAGYVILDADTHIILVRVDPLNLLPPDIAEAMATVICERLNMFDPLMFDPLRNKRSTP